MPKITVLMSVLNENPAYLKKAIESISKQTFQDFEFIIIDDGSDQDECKTMLVKYANLDQRIRLITHQKNIGLTKSLNEGLHLAQGEYVARLDSDDIASADRLEKQFSFMEKNRNIALCGSHAKVIDENGAAIGEMTPPIDTRDIMKKILISNPLIHSTWFFRKKEIISLGGYDENMEKAQDYDLVLRLSAHHSIANLPDYLCQYRMRRDSITFSKNKSQEKFALIARLEALKRGDFSNLHYLQLFRPVLMYFLLPFKIKKFLIKLLWKI